MTQEQRHRYGLKYFGKVKIWRSLLISCVAIRGFYILNRSSDLTKNVQRIPGQFKRAIFSHQKFLSINKL